MASTSEQTSYKLQRFTKTRMHSINPTIPPQEPARHLYQTRLPSLPIHHLITPRAMLLQAQPALNISTPEADAVSVSHVTRNLEPVHLPDSCPTPPRIFGELFGIPTAEERSTSEGLGKKPRKSKGREPEHTTCDVASSLQRTGLASLLLPPVSQPQLPPLVPTPCPGPSSSPYPALSRA